MHMGGTTAWGKCQSIGDFSYLSILFVYVRFLCKEDLRICSRMQLWFWRGCRCHRRGCLVLGLEWPRPDNFYRIALPRLCGRDWFCMFLFFWNHRRLCDVIVDFIFDLNLIGVGIGTGVKLWGQRVDLWQIICYLQGCEWLSPISFIDDHRDPWDLVCCWVYLESDS